MNRFSQGFIPKHPRRIFWILGILVVALGALTARIRVDTDPENMLSADAPVRVYHNAVKKRFQLHDTVVIGVEYPAHPEGVFNPESLGRVYALSKQIETLDHVIAHDLLDPVHVDNIKETAPGTVSFQWLLPEPPKTQAEADAVRQAALRLPMLNGTLVSEDGKTLALYVPVTEKSHSHAVSEAIRSIIRSLDGPETYHFAGLPIAEDTFGVEMFQQMAVSAPLAALVIFLLMWLFFRSFALVLSPMIVAVATVVMTMGALIGLGNTLHIMSSMIPIFLMPIAVVDSVHILSEFADLYPQEKDAKTTIRKVVGHLFMPMLYTSLTSAAGFLSLLLTPIPPVRVFGGFVALGIALAFLLTVVFIPAYVLVLSPAQLEGIVRAAKRNADRESQSPLVKVVHGLRTLALGAPRWVVSLSLLLLALGTYGVTRIQINDNPVRWFQDGHPIRVADATLNQALAGTYPAYLILEPKEAKQEPIDAARNAMEQFTAVDRKAAFEKLVNDPESSFPSAFDDQIFEDPEGQEAWSTALRAYEVAESKNRIFEQSEMLNWVEQVQKEAASIESVGKTTSIVDVVKTVYRELKSGNPDAFVVPNSQAGVAQTLLTYQSAHRPADLFHLVTPDFRSAAIWFQLRKGDNQDMASIKDRMDEWLATHPAPYPIEARWAGLTYINVVWQNDMVKGMLESLLGAFVIVFLMMVVLFRSIPFGLLSMVPLAFTIILIYGLTGIMGKDYDMPVAVLSSLSLGLSVDFAIHFLERSRSLAKETGSWALALPRMFEAPGRAITRNAIVVAIGFLPLLFAHLVPYQTVGLLMAAIMTVSSLVTLVLLPAILQLVTARSKGISSEPDPSTHLSLSKKGLSQ